MKLVSVNVGLPKEVTFNGRSFLTSIFKEPINTPVKVSFLNLEGDRQADGRVHGGVDKAIYAYSSENYRYWEKKLNKLVLPWGIFGENLTIDGDFLEDKIHIGDVFKVGSVELMVVQPRTPCSRLAARFNDSQMVKLFLESKLSGVYFKVIKEGNLQVGDTFELIKKDENNISIKDIYNLLHFEKDNFTLFEKVLQMPALADEIKNELRKKYL